MTAHGHTAAGATSVLCILGTELALLAGLFEGRLDTPTYLSLHVLLCASIAGFGYVFARQGAAEYVHDETALVLQLAAWTTLAGPFGTVLAAALLVPWSPGERSDAAERRLPPPTPTSELTQVENLHGLLLDDRLRLGQAHAVRPLYDVVLDGAKTEKFEALSLISKRYHAALAPALRRALEDKDGSVRVLAATVIAHQNNRYTKAIGDRQSTAQTEPEIARYWSALGQAFLDYAESGLLEPPRARGEAAQALDCFLRAVALDGNDITARTGIGIARDRFAISDTGAATGDNAIGPQGKCHAQ